MMLAYKMRTLQAKVQALKEAGVEALDMENPLAKMFLHRCENPSELFGQQPKASEATDLAQLLFSHSSNLLAPDILEQLQAHHVENSTQQWIMQNVHAPAVHVRCRDNSVKGLSGFLGDNSDQEVIPRGSAPVEISDPSVAQSLIGRDVFLDYISPRSPLAGSQCPLSVTVKQCVANPVEPAAHCRPMKFMSMIELGYSNEGYHWKLHAADIPNRHLYSQPDRHCIRH
mmetsp:Transcript_1424/g.4134  ORF Transcript_1424/g.4134 Transcript_1424/m.4134 type:complete len:228 (+) Transcript_1424:36-719(+)